MADTLAPTTEEENLERRRTRNLLWTGVGLLLVSLPLPLLGTLWGMFDSFQEIERHPAPTPADLARGVHVSMLASIVGALAALVGLALVILASARSRREPPATLDRRDA